MADLSQIKLPNGSTYDLKDAVSRKAGIYYGTCATAAGTKAKVVTLTDNDSFSLETGAVVVVKFTYASAAATMTMNVNGTGAKNLYQYGTTTMANGTTTSGWSANALVPFVYDGSGWHRFYWYNTTYSAMSASEATTGTATSARLITAKVLHDKIEEMLTSIDITVSNKTLVVPSLAPISVSDDKLVIN